jgi:hypothetical protein
VNGESDDQTKMSVVLAFVHEWFLSRTGDFQPLTESWSEELANKADEKPVPAFSPCRLEIITVPVKGVPRRVIHYSFWTKNDEGLGPWHGPPFATIFTEHLWRYDAETGAVVSASGASWSIGDTRPKFTISLECESNDEK